MPMLRTETVVTEFTKIETAEGGSTIGQLIDDKIQDHINKSRASSVSGSSRIGAIHFEFDDERDWWEYANGLDSGVSRSKAKKIYEG